MIKSILLVDDNEATNFYNEVIIEESGVVEEVQSVQSGAAALALLGKRERGEHAPFDLILLDINMPVMTGWEFLEEYGGCLDGQRPSILVLMLTTSLSPDDHEKAEANPLVSGLQNKPLSADAIREIDRKFFS